MNFTELAQEVYRACYLTGQFKLRSGIMSSEYFDKYRFESKPKLLANIAKLLAPKVSSDIELLAGLELGGIPIATALSLETGLPQLMVRKKAKEYGTCQFAEGGEFANKKVLVIEDVVTTGGQLLESTRMLREAGAIIDQAICVIYRGDRNENPLAPLDMSLDFLFHADDLRQP